MLVYWRNTYIKLSMDGLVQICRPIYTITNVNKTQSLSKNPRMKRVTHHLCLKYYCIYICYSGIKKQRIRHVLDEERAAEQSQFVSSLILSDLDNIMYQQYHQMDRLKDEVELLLSAFEAHVTAVVRLDTQQKEIIKEWDN
jgi:hypothetical protein